MKIITSLFVLLLAQCVLGQEIEYPYKHDLKGPVQACSEKKFKAVYSPQGNVVQGAYQDDDKWGIQRFDPQGRLVEFRTQADTATGKYTRTELTYDPAGCWQKVTEYHEQGSFKYSQVYRCDHRGVVSERLDYSYLYADKATGVTTYKHDAAGHVTEKHYRYGNPKPDKYDHRYYEYDKNGFLVKWSIKRDGIDPELAAILSGTAEVTNDVQGRPIAEYGLNDSAAKAGKAKKLQKELVYNAEGFLAQLVEYAGYGGAKTTYYEYTYDDRGNWITRVELQASAKPGKVNAVPMTITVREIKYY
jgi:hypothetical protein